MSSKKHKPRSGSLAFYPRKRAKTEFPRFRNFPKLNELKLLNFAGYKAGMSYVITINNSKGSPTYNQEIQIPVTIIETPPIKIVGLRVYKKTPYGIKALKEYWNKKLDKELTRKIKKQKKTHEISNLKELKEFDDIKLIAHTQPKLSGIGKKKPEIFEIALSGKLEEKIDFSLNLIGKEIKISEIFQKNELIDVKGVTKGKGMTGVVKRFGTKILRQPKHKKARVVGSIGPWHPALVQWEVPRAGQHGYHNRTEFNKKIVLIDDKTQKINPKGGFINYGIVKNDFVVIAGSIPGCVKRPIALRKAIRPKKKETIEIGEIKLINLESQQGV